LKGSAGINTDTGKVSIGLWRKKSPKGGQNGRKKGVQDDYKRERDGAKKKPRPERVRKNSIKRGGGSKKRPFNIKKGNPQKQCTKKKKYLANAEKTFKGNTNRNEKKYPNVTPIQKGKFVDPQKQEASTFQTLKIK